MPGGGGPRFAHEVQACSPDTRVVALSAYEDRSHRVRDAAGRRGRLPRQGHGRRVRDPDHGRAGRPRAVHAVVVGHLGRRPRAGAASPAAAGRRACAARARRAPARDASTRAASRPSTSRSSSSRAAVSSATRRWPGSSRRPSRAPRPGSPTRRASGWASSSSGWPSGLRSQVSRELPPDCFLAVNLSPAAHPRRRGARPARSGGAEPDRGRDHRAQVDRRLRPHLTALLGLRARGLRLAVDDAGAGYASLRHLLEIRPDLIKLDASLTRGDRRRARTPRPRESADRLRPGHRRRARRGGHRDGGRGGGAEEARHRPRPGVPPGQAGAAAAAGRRLATGIATDASFVGVAGALSRRRLV